MDVGVTFRSALFSLEPPVENGRSYDVPLGDDLANHLAKRFRETAPDIRVSEAVREDWGTVLDVEPPGERYRLYIQWVGYRASDREDEWGIQLANESPHGVLGPLLRRRRPAIHEARIRGLIAAILSSSADFLDVTWFTRDEYEKRL